jgi:hypothetical protein
MLPTTISEVITTLERIMDECEQTKNPLGYFAALYHKVTCRVREGIIAGEFENDKRMERFDVVFANRYIQAWQAFQQNAPASDSWIIAFRAKKKSRTLVLQHLLLGMNAHINLDLGIAAAEIAQAQGLPAVRKDFAAINGILALLSGDVMGELRRVSPLLSLMGLHQSRQQSALIQFSLSNARDGAWCFAEELFTAAQEEHESIIAARDKSIAALAESILDTRGLMRITAWLIHLFEWRNPRRIIGALRSSSPTFIKAKQLAANSPGL